MLSNLLGGFAYIISNVPPPQPCAHAIGGRKVHVDLFQVVPYSADDNIVLIFLFVILEGKLSS